MPTRRELEEQIVEFSHRLYGKGWVANHDGNISAHLGNGRILATPTSVSKGDVDRRTLIVVDEKGSVVSGSRKAFSELDLHLYIYRHRPDVHAVIHSHAPHATALAVAGIDVQAQMMPEPVVSLGAQIPLVAYAPPKTPECTLNLGPYIDDVDAVTLENHGVLSWGPDLETAFLRMELVEHLARIQLISQQVGGARTLPETEIAPLLASRAKAGLGKAGREAKKETPAEPVGAVVREEVARALHEKGVI